MKDRTTIRTLAFCAALLASVAYAPSIAWAQSSDGHTGGSSHSGGGGKGGHESGSHEEGGHEEGGSSGHGGRRGGRGVEGRVFHGGERGGRGGESGVEDRVLRGRGGGSGGKPAWAGGAVPEDVELGRLNMARSPAQVLGRALDEAYSTNLDKNADGVLDADASLTGVESPMQNLALYKEAIAGARKVSGTWTLQQAAAFLGKASDKEIAVTPEVVRALSVILAATPDLAAFTYDRAATYPADFTAVFGGAAYTGSGETGFAQAADDARAIVKYHHDNPG